jgi:hypothetical protein
MSRVNILGYQATLPLSLIQTKKYCWIARTNDRQQVQQLDNIFRREFGYRTKVINLSGRCSCRIGCHCTPQQQLDKAVARYMQKHDHSSNLTIIYYTGHGSYHAPQPSDTHNGYLKLHAYVIISIVGCNDSADQEKVR